MSWHALGRITYGLSRFDPARLVRLFPSSLPAEIWNRLQLTAYHRRTCGFRFMMDQSTSISSNSRNHAMTPEETGMEQVLSDLQALKGLYGLLHNGKQHANENLDEASRSVLMRMLDDATHQALVKQAKLLSGPLMSPALERRLSIQPGRRTGGDAEQRLKPLPSPGPSEWSRRLKPPQSPARSRDDWRASDDHRRRGRDDPPLARVVSNRSLRTAVPWLHPSTPEQRLARLGSYRSSYRVAEPRRDIWSGSDSRAGRSRRHSRLRRGSGRGDHSSSSPESPARSRDDRRRARDDPLLARVVSNRSSRTAMPQLYPTTTEQRLAQLGSYRSCRVAEPRRDVGRGSDSRAGRSRLRRGSGRGDRSSSSPESSCRRCSESRGPSTARRVGAGGSWTSRRVGRLDSRLSMGGVTSRCGSGRAARRGEITPRGSSSSSNGEAVTTRSRIRPNRELMERCVRRAEEIREQSLRRRGNKDGTVRSGVGIGLSRSSHRPRRALERIDSGSTYSSGSSSPSSGSVPSLSTVPTAPSTSLGASASPCSSSASVSVSPRGDPGPEHPFEEASSTSRSRRRRERQERREGRLRRFKNKLALVFHHRHDHHHHHHVGRGCSPLPTRDRRGKNGKSPWSFLGGMFHHGTAGPGPERGKKKSTSRTVVTAKRRAGGGGHARSLFDALVRHKRAAPRAARAPVVRPRSLSRVQAKKIHWWQGLKQRRGRSSKPRRRLLGQGKTLL